MSKENSAPPSPHPAWYPQVQWHGQLAQGSPGFRFAAPSRVETLPSPQRKQQSRAKRKHQAGLLEPLTQLQILSPSWWESLTRGSVCLSAQPEESGVETK